MVRIGSTDGVYGDYGENKSKPKETDPKNIKLFNFKQEDAPQIRKNESSKNKIEELKNKPYSEKEILKACAGDQELFQALEKAGYVEKVSEGQYKVSGLSDALAKFLDPVDNSINMQAAKAVLSDSFADSKIDRISDKQAKKLAKFCGFNVKKDNQLWSNVVGKVAGLGSTINNEEITLSANDLTIRFDSSEAAKNFIENTKGQLSENIVMQQDGNNVKITDNRTMIERLKNMGEKFYKNMKESRLSESQQ